MRRTYTIAIIIVAALVSAALWWYVATHPSRTTKALYASLQNTDFSALTQETGETLASTDNPRVRDAARAVNAYALYMQGTEAARLQAIEAAKTRYTEATSDLDRSQALNQLLQFVASVHSNATFEAVFGDSRFHQYEKDGDFAGSISALAQASYALHPTVIAAGYSLYADAMPLLSRTSRRALTPEERDTHARAIMQGMSRLDLGRLADNASVTPYTALLAPFSYYHWQAYLYGALAAIDPPHYNQKADEAYRSLIGYYLTTTDADGNRNSMLTVRMPYEYMHYAAFLLTIRTASSTEKARGALDQAMYLVRRDPPLHESGLIGFVRSVAADATLDQESNAALLRMLAEAFPPFGDFIHAYGFPTATSTKTGADRP